MQAIRTQCREKLQSERRVILSALQQPAADGEVHAPHAVTHQLRQRMLEELARIDRAITRMAQGCFGQCQECGQPIDPDRLHVLPTAELCVRCRHGLEKDGAGHHLLKRSGTPPLGRARNGASGETARP